MESEETATSKYNNGNHFPASCARDTKQLAKGSTKELQTQRHARCMSNDNNNRSNQNTRTRGRKFAKKHARALFFLYFGTNLVIESFLTFTWNVSLFDHVVL